MDEAIYPPNEHTLIAFDWEEVEHQTVTAILGEYAYPGSWRRIAIMLGEKGVILRAKEWLADNPSSKCGWTSITTALE